MARSLVFISGGSSGIGRALAKTTPLEDARIIDVSRRSFGGWEHFAADLADPPTWQRVAALFDREVDGFSGDRVVFIHCAGTLTPIGFAGEVDAAAYARNVLLNSAAPQVLGAAFLRALRGCRTPAHLVMISSGAAEHVYEGWTSYGAGKAAVNQWVRTAGAEQARRGDRCRVLAIAPGIVATPMQEEIRAMPESSFPEVAKFAALHESDALRQPEAVAREIWQLLLSAHANGAVVDLRDRGA